MTSTPAACPRTVGRIYVPLGLTCLVIAIAGFWPTYFGPLLFEGRLHPLPIIHVHAAVLTTWLLLVIAQAVLAARRQIALHMKIGTYGMAWGVLVVLLGWATAISRFGDRVLAGHFAEAESQLFAPITDMFFFIPALTAAWIYRREPEIHKRLIVVATTILLVAAVHRMVFLGGRPPPWPPVLAVWLSPICLGMICDWYKKRIFHPVYLIGIVAVLLMKFGRAPLRQTEVWMSFVNWLAGFYR